MSHRPALADLEPNGIEDATLAMDLGFAVQAHSLRALAQDPARFTPGYNAVPADIDSAVAREALTTLSSVETE